MHWRIFVEELGSKTVWCDISIAYAWSQLEDKGDPHCHKMTHKQMRFAMILFTLVRQDEEYFIDEVDVEGKEPFLLDLETVAHE